MYCPKEQKFCFSKQFQSHEILSLIIFKTVGEHFKAHPHFANMGRSRRLMGGGVKTSFENHKCLKVSIKSQVQTTLSSNGAPVRIICAENMQLCEFAALFYVIYVLVLYKYY